MTVIDFCLYIAIKFHTQFNRSEKWGRITHPASQSTQLLKLSYFVACTFGQTLGATDFSCAVSGFGQSREVKYFCHRC